MHTAAVTLPANRLNGAPSRLDAPDPIDVHVGERVKARRRMLNISQEALGKALGLTFQQVQKYESGTNRISSSRLFDIAAALNTEPGEFFKGIGADVIKARPVQVPADLAVALAEKAANDPLQNPEVMAILDAFARIDDAATRQHIVWMVDKLAG